MNLINDNKISTKEVFLLSILFIIKLIFFNFFIGLQSHIFLLILISSAFFLLMLYIFNNYMKNGSIVAVICFYTIISTLMFADAVYYQYFNQMPSVVLLKMVGLLPAVSSSVSYLLKPIYILFFIDIAFIAIYVNKLRERSNLLIENSSFSLTEAPILKSMYVIIAAIFVTFVFQGYGISFFKQEFFSYHINDVFDTLVATDDIVIDTFSVNAQGLGVDNDLSSNNKYFGVAKDKNLIVIQVEAMQDFVINRTYNSQEITPNLNKLINKDTIYFDKYYHQLSRGNTSDAEFVTNNSLFGSMDGQTYTLYEKNRFYGLPWILKSRGYNTIALHGYKAEFWNRENAYPYQGFDDFKSEDDFILNETIGLGLTDKDFFIQSADYLADIEEPFYGFMVTLSSHHPFDIPIEYRRITLEPEHEGTIFGNYLNSMSYVDEQLGLLLDELKKKGLYDNSVIAIYGDHFGMSISEPDTKEFVSELIGYEYYYDEMLNVPLIIHIPGSDVTETTHIAGGQIDFMPTMLNLLGIVDEKAVMFGQDLNNATEGFVAEQYYILKGSFIDDNKIFVMSRDGIFENSEALDLNTREKIPVEECREGYEKVFKMIDESDYILRNDLLKELIDGKEEN